ACTELHKETVAIYSAQDSLSLHRYKADESYLIGRGKGPVEAYLDIDGIVDLALRHRVDAVHPGYGFLSENPAFARRCQEAGVTFIGPRPEHLELFGDKLRAKALAHRAGLPVVPGSDGPIDDPDKARAFADRIGYPIIVKAVAGGGGRGMRVVRSPEELRQAMERARSEAEAAFGSGAVYLEKYLERPKHVEVQVLADAHGHMVHLFERDCSIQRRHQKLVEVAPSPSLSEATRQALCDAALRLMREVDYVNAGTVEFLLDEDGSFYFIEVNPRIQVEHTVTELVTGIDIVQAQIRVAEGYRLADPVIGIGSQEDVVRRGFAIQCRVTTEDPRNGFLPDTGRIVAYRTAGGFGVRLDAGNGHAGAVITPYYDSLLVKYSTWGLTLESAAAKMARALRELRIRGVKTNSDFLLNVVQHPQFLAGNCDTTFVDSTPELYVFPERRDRGTKLLGYIAETIVNGAPGMTEAQRARGRPEARTPVP
ncbi:MAG: ATP-grasp domain-containing protein, partial [Clostridia bacterium]|nr:ATP-grasp domain-containing protein [Clostridia bacterium]